jgi:hypothetical protein
MYAHTDWKDIFGLYTNHIGSKVQFFYSNTSITFMKYSLGYMFRPQLGHHQTLYMYKSFLLQYILGFQTVF